MSIEKLLDKMWLDYIDLNPLAQKILQTLHDEGEEVVNDHIALRTFRHHKVSIDVMARPFVEAGYKECGQYDFPDKKLFAKHYEHIDDSLPKIFISELLLDFFTPSLRQIVENLINQVPVNFDFSSIGRPWNISVDNYKSLLQESEYAAWVSAIGYRPNHFTVLVNKLKKYQDLETLNAFLKSRGFKLNSSGGEIKGSKSVFLEQSSTLANSIDVDFEDGRLVVPGCYYEFAKRYELESGKLYQGFVAKSADKIFESTNRID